MDPAAHNRWTSGIVGRVPPRRPEQPLLWTQAEVDSLIKQQIISPDSDGLSPLLQAANLTMTTLRDRGWTAIGGKENDERGQVPMLASIAVLEALSRFCESEARARIADTRKIGCTWDQIARATGYASGDTARTHFSSTRRAADQARRRQT